SNDKLKARSRSASSASKASTISSRLLECMFEFYRQHGAETSRVDSSEMRAKGPEMRLRCLIGNARVRRAYLIGQP
ncbi:hypothetical protein, partial [Mycobacterium sp.]|uniref:hypothetical protein n=1 Tax=Mycobacterium sp. TaxID=1785 RepID=UPI003F9D40AA